MPENDDGVESVGRVVPADYKDIVEAARHLFREVAAANHTLTRNLTTEKEESRLTILAAVEGLEMLTKNLEAYEDILPEETREALKVAAEYAWQRLESSGIRRDGVPGEPIDLKRHRVVKNIGEPSLPERFVIEVVNPGILFRGRRLREIAVVAGTRGRHNAAGRD